MVISFLIATLVLFIINLSVALIVIALSVNDGVKPITSMVSVLISLIMITWNIFAIVYL